MSGESLAWLNNNTLIGFTEKRGNAWHYDGESDNHYPGAIPVVDVKRRLFDWEAVPTAEQWTVGDVTYTGQDVVWVRSDKPSHKLGTFAAGYQGHQYGDWLVDNVANILDSSLSIGSAGLLKGGAVAWVSVEVPDTITTPEGVQFRPNLLAVTSFDGSLKTTYKRVVTNVVCDNTMAQGLSESGQQFAVKHTRNSQLRLADARQALEVVFTISEDFAAAVKELSEYEVSKTHFEAFMDALVPLPEKEGRGTTMAINKRERMVALWHNDPRVAPWSGTAWGVAQMVNTYNQHEAIVRNAAREERRMMNALTGATQKADAEALELLYATA